MGCEIVQVAAVTAHRGWRAALHKVLIVSEVVDSFVQLAALPVLAALLTLGARFLCARVHSG